ncbi:cation:proton antiporter [Kineococcus rhizosphaerae]|uniref:Sodium/proton antiporter (CPA1 family) n=1 Tax=Kineococcus rhizosphaerae TaxID=559628 RepID=A0A2T0R4E7_9ACTN|nr:cation:proton antiporter [Kineococcus rhizosphaerae]PRY15200.1 sodium/proton antiporter (CPA1 family) [Kineococcus rhizosphaerae]
MFAQLLIVVFAALALTIVAARRGWQPPLLLAIAGAAVSFVPGVPRVELSPEAILTVVLPPLLFSTTQDFSLSGFVRRWRSITNLGVLLVVVTTAVVGLVASLAIPWVTLSTALVLAAVVSPPDAVTAVAIGGRLGLPSRVLNTLKGESLVNDAAALTLFSVTVAAATHSDDDGFLPANPVLFFLVTAAIGTAVGFALGHLAAAVRAKLTEPSLMTAFAVLLPFAAYAVAEAVDGSGVLAVVVAGFVLSRHSLSAVYATRLAEREIWNVVDVLLEAFVFAYLGLQFHFLLADAVTDGSRAWSLLAAGLVVLAAVVLVRVAWVLGGGFLMRNLLHGRFSPGGRHYSPAEDVVLAWTGMRGVVTLAAAAGIPEDFPHRADLQVLAFVVAVGTLLLQGSTLPPLIGRLHLDTSRERTWREAERRKAQDVSRASMFEVLRVARDEATDPRERDLVDALLERADRLSRARLAEQEENEGTSPTAARAVEVRRRTLVAQRGALLAAEESGEVSEDAVREALEQLDLDEASLAHRGSPRL